MSKKIFSAQEWENVHSEALPSKLNDVEKQTSSIVYSDVEEDLNRVVCEIESLHIDIAPSYNDWVNLGFAIADGCGESGRTYFHRLSKPRLGRNLFMIMEILNICMTKECRVWTIKDNYRLGDDIQSKVLAFAFGLSAEIERNLISQRTKEALARKKAEGVILGRPKGRKSAPEKYKLHGKETLIRELLKANVSKRKIAKLCKVDRNTLDRYIKHFLSEQN